MAGQNRLSTRSLRLRKLGRSWLEKDIESANCGMKSFLDFGQQPCCTSPRRLGGRVPAVMSVLGHFYGKGKAMNFNQELCINYALRGVLAVTPEWLDMGELNNPESSHLNYEAHIDFVGANPVGLFYLAMRRVLDYLSNHPHVDTNRIGVTGLSGGGWQTITLSALDPRIYASVPVAGFQSVLSSLDYMSGPGRLDPNTDMEQSPTDLFTILDNETLAR